MRILTASAFALAMLVGLGGASACEFHMESMAYATPAPVAAPTVTAKERLQIVAYLEELSDRLSV
jgi:hypothetical protein